VSYYEWAPYVSVAERRRQAERALQKLVKKGQVLAPVVLEGRAIAHTFWGKAWCENLERYSDYANRLPRGRTYVRNGSVLDLQLSPGQVKALVSGSELYQVDLKVKPVPPAQWAALCGDCAGAIDSLVELLQGRFSKGVMERLCRAGTGLFPAPSEIQLACSCPDWATMCKHVAAVLYGVGARLDEQPELLFRLRGVEASELLAKAAGALPLAQHAPAHGKVLEGDDLAALFGLELATTEAAQTSKPASKAKRAAPRPAKTMKPKATPKTTPTRKPMKAKPPAKPSPKPRAKVAAQPVKQSATKPRAKVPAKIVPKPPVKTTAPAKPKPKKRSVLD